MKSLILHLAVLAAFFAIACAIRPQPTHSASEIEDRRTLVTSAEDAWRRTAQGWERVADWSQPEPIDLGAWNHLRAVHPAVVASLQLLVSVGALLHFQGETFHGETAGDRPRRRRG